MQLNYSLTAVDVGVLRPPTVVGYMVDDDIIWGDDSSAVTPERAWRLICLKLINRDSLLVTDTLAPLSTCI